MFAAPISLILPVRDAGDRLVSVVHECLAVLTRVVADFELIIVDDGSRDTTAVVVDQLATVHDAVLAIHHRQPQGYGYALLNGWQAARGEYVLAADLAGLAGIGELERLLPYLDQHAVVLAYPRHPPPDRTNQLRARLFADLARSMLGDYLHDPGFRLALFRADLLHELAPDEVDDLVQLELYLRAGQRGLGRVQVAINTQAPRVGMPLDGSPAAFLRLKQRLSTRQAQPSDPDQLGERAAIATAALAAGAGVFLLLRRIFAAQRGE